MRTTEEHAAINRMLQSHGLGRLEDGAGLMSQLGFMVQDHEHLRSLLVRCEPENRSSMYDSLKPYLRFTPKPLDVYISESAERAAREDGVCQPPPYGHLPQMHEDRGIGAGSYEVSIGPRSIDRGPSARPGGRAQTRGSAPQSSIAAAAFQAACRVDLLRSFSVSRRTGTLSTSLCLSRFVWAAAFPHIEYSIRPVR